MRASLALIRLQRSLARKYRPDQPRVPAGSGLESGRWTRIGGGAPAGEHPSRPADRIVVAGGYSFGRLIGQTPATLRSRTCFYEFDFAIIAVPGPTNFNCSPLVPSAAVSTGF